MTIKSYILKKYKKHIDLVQSASTNSLYITLFKEYTIRLSDHMPSETRHGVDMYITMMTNTRKLYTVAFYPTRQQRLMSYKEIIAYIDSLCLMFEVRRSDFALATYRKQEKELKSATNSVRSMMNRMKEGNELILEAERIKDEYKIITADFYLSLQKIRTGGLSADEYVETDEVKTNPELRSKSPIYEVFLDNVFLKDCPQFLLVEDREWLKKMLRPVLAYNMSYKWITLYLNDMYENKGMKTCWDKAHISELLSKTVPAWKKAVKDAKTIKIVKK